MTDPERGYTPDFAPPGYTILDRFVDAQTGEQVTRVALEGDDDVVEFRIHVEERDALLDGFMRWKEENQ